MKMAEDREKEVSCGRKGKEDKRLVISKENADPETGLFDLRLLTNDVIRHSDDCNFRVSHSGQPCGTGEEHEKRR